MADKTQAQTTPASKPISKTKSILLERLGVIANPDEKRGITLAGDIISDLKDAFAMYDTEDLGVISPGDFKVILQNFGFSRLQKSAIEQEIQKLDKDYLTRTGFDYKYLETVVNNRLERKRGKEQEADEAFDLFDTKKRNIVTA